jgi:hypothetical protein
MASTARSLMFTILGDTLLVVHGPMDPEPEEWRELMAASRSTAQSYRRCLVLAGGVTLKAKQRSELADLVNTNGCRVAVLIDSAIARGMVTALGWVTGNKYRAFAMGAIDDAMAYLGGNLDPVEVHGTIDSMREQMSQRKLATG